MRLITHLLLISYVFLAAILKTSRGDIVDVRDYWPEIKDDLTDVTWSHATNSKKDLENALKDETIMMIEADVNEGIVLGTNKLQPIMAHPPDLFSDLSLDEFMNQFTNATQNGLKKGIKLDFKNQDIIEESFQIMQLYQALFDFPLWINADILPGPGSNSLGINPDIFLPLCKVYFPQATISTGWTTKVPSDPDLHHYTDEQVEEMIETLNENMIGQTVTFPVRAIFVGNSYDQLQYLIDETKEQNGTLTIWGTDSVENVDDLIEVIEAIGRDKIYLDVSEELSNEIG